MREKKLQKAIDQLMRQFRGSFINHLNELILVPKTNLYFLLGDVKTVLDLKCKVIAWCSRAACKTAPYSVQWRNEQYQSKVREAINNFLGVKFNADEWLYIYTYLGNDIRRKLCESFVKSGYKLSVIEEGRKNEG